ncbi:MAG: ion channel [Thermodesulfobacteriota bacterium]
MGLPLQHGISRFYRFWWEGRGFSALLLILLLVFFLSPFIESTLTGFFLAVFYIPLLISGVATVTESRFLRTVAAVGACLVLVFHVLNQNFPGRFFAICWYFSIVAFFFLMISVLMHRVFREGPVTRHRIRGAIAAYLLIGITWSYIYMLISLLINDAFSFPPSTIVRPDDPGLHSTLTYYSFVTLTTLGYGDVVPVHPVARMFAILEALLGMLFPATLLARLVSLEIMYRHTPGIGKPPEEDSKDDRW